MSDLPTRDERVAFDYPGPSTAVELRAQHGAAVSVVTADEIRAEIIGGRVARLCAATGEPADLDLDTIRRLAGSPQVLGPGEATVPEALLPAILDATITAMRRDSRARTVQVQTDAQSLAACITGSHIVWIDKSGAVRWQRRTADPVRGGGGPMPEPPPPASSGLRDRFRIKREPVGEIVTTESIKTFIVGAGLLQPHQRPDWSEVLDELRALAAR